MLLGLLLGILVSIGPIPGLNNFPILYINFKSQKEKSDLTFCLIHKHNLSKWRYKHPPRNCSYHNHTILAKWNYSIHKHTINIWNIISVTVYFIVRAKNSLAQGHWTVWKSIFRYPADKDTDEESKQVRKTSLLFNNGLSLLIYILSRNHIYKYSWVHSSSVNRCLRVRSLKKWCWCVSVLQVPQTKLLYLRCITGSVLRI